jgi:hypothetical protein
MMRCKLALSAAVVSVALLGGVSARAWDIFSDIGGGISNAGKDALGSLDKLGRDIDKKRLDIMSRTPRPGRDYTKVYVYNRTDKPVSVAVMYLDFDVSGQSLSRTGGSSNDSWAIGAWFNLGPGDKAHVANTNNRNFYYYAFGGGREWAGDVTRTLQDGGKPRTVGFRMTPLVTQLEESEVNLTEKSSKPISGQFGLSKADREPQIAFRIDDKGRAYAGNTLLGQGRRVVNNQTRRTAWRYDIPNGWSLIRYDGSNETEKHIYKNKAAQAAVTAPGAGGVFSFAPQHASAPPVAVQEAPLEATTPPPASAPDAAPAPEATTPPPASAPADDKEIFASNLGIYYEKVDYGDGTFGARLTRDAASDTPAGTLGLEKGDTIFALDDMRFRTPQDVLAHTQSTKVDFVNVRTNAPQTGSVTLP